MNRPTINCLILIFLSAGFCSNVFSQLAIDGVSFKNAKLPYDNVITGGQPSISDLKILSEMNVKNIINLRGPDEFDNFDEANEVKELGLNYVTLEVAGASGITVENAIKLDKILKSLQGNTFVHCASGNRVGALFAVRAAVVNNKSVEASLKEGIDAGLKSLYDKTKKLLIENSQ